MFVKVYGTILDSSIWSEDLPTRIVWITMLAMADEYGNVHASVPGLARRANVTIPQTQAALDVFLTPDPYDRSGIEEGRRCQVIQGGWHVINHKKYRDLRTPRQVADAERKRAERAGRPKDMSQDKPDSPNCPGHGWISSREAEADPEADPDPNAEGRARTPVAQGVPDYGPGVDPRAQRIARLIQGTPKLEGVPSLQVAEAILGKLDARMMRNSKGKHIEDHWIDAAIARSGDDVEAAELAGEAPSLKAIIRIVTRYASDPLPVPFPDDGASSEKAHEQRKAQEARRFAASEQRRQGEAAEARAVAAGNARPTPKPPLAQHELTSNIGEVMAAIMGKSKGATR